MTDVRAVLIDDNPEDLKIANRLSRAGLPCDGVLPARSMDEMRSFLRKALAERRYDVVLLDYRLDGERPREVGGEDATYRGGSVAAELKELYPGLPVVLVTTEEKLQRWLLHNPRVRQLFDHHLIKNRLVTTSQRRLAAEQVKDLAIGFKEIGSALGKDDQDSWETLLRLLQAQAEDELPSVVSGDAPVGAGEVASWLLRSPLRYPGVLLEDCEVSVRIGLSRKAFEKPAVRSLFAEAQYSGPFSVMHPRWWRGRVQRALVSLAGDAAFADAAVRAKSIGEAAGVHRLPIAKCVWCGGGESQRCCWRCEQAVDVRHCLVAYVDERPRWAEPAVVCFECIQVGRAEGLRFQSGTSELVEGLRSGSLTREVRDA